MLFNQKLFRMMCFVFVQKFDFESGLALCGYQRGIEYRHAHNSAVHDLKHFTVTTL
jgi:hypothetical protein